jgi:hypothetical protein
MIIPSRSTVESIVALEALPASADEIDRLATALDLMRSRGRAFDSVMQDDPDAELEARSDLWLHA